jgi:nicotinamidase-related amidase
MAELDFQPYRSVLLNIDMQHFFVEGAPDGTIVVDRINRLAASCRRTGVVVIHTTAGLSPDIPDFEQALALHQGLATDPSDIVFPKHHFDAFHESELTTILRARSIDTVIISGIRTNVCCMATAWGAIARQFRVFFLRDGTATKEMGGVSPSILQLATCATFSHLFGNVISVDEMVERIEKSAHPTP